MPNIIKADEALQGLRDGNKYFTSNLRTQESLIKVTILFSGPSKPF